MTVTTSSPPFPVTHLDLYHAIYLRHSNSNNENTPICHLGYFGKNLCHCTSVRALFAVPWMSASRRVPLRPGSLGVVCSYRSTFDPSPEPRPSPTVPNAIYLPYPSGNFSRFGLHSYQFQSLDILND